MVRKGGISHGFNDRSYFCPIISPSPSYRQGSLELCRSSVKRFEAFHLRPACLGVAFSGPPRLTARLGRMSSRENMASMPQGAGVRNRTRRGEQKELADVGKVETAGIEGAFSGAAEGCNVEGGGVKCTCTHRGLLACIHRPFQQFGRGRAGFIA